MAKSPPSGAADSARPVPPPISGRRSARAPLDGSATAPIHGFPPSIAALQAHSLPALVQRDIERMILGGEIAPGSKLNEAALAELLGVSRGPVREAFRALEESGLVRLEKNRGVYVRQIPVEEADEIYELRALLDAFVGQRVAATATPAAVRELRAMVAAMERASAGNDVDAFLKANLAFHDRLVELAGNRKLLATYRRLVNELRLFRRTTLAQEGALPTSTREHRQIVERIAAGDVPGAGRALHDHVVASRERMHRINGRAGPAKGRNGIGIANPPARKAR